MSVGLQQLARRSWAEVVDVRGPHDDVDRLKALGVCIGRKLQLVGGGDPVIVRVLGAHVGVSGRLAEGVLVQPLKSAP